MFSKLNEIERKGGEKKKISLFQKPIMKWGDYATLLIRVEISTNLFLHFFRD